MKLNLIDEIVLIALDDVDGKFITDTAHLNYGIAGSILLELSLERKIELKEDKLAVINTDTTDNPVLDRAIELITNTKKPKSVKYWIEQFGFGAEGIKDETVDHLTKAHILRKDAGKILWIIPTTKFPTENPQPENQVRNKLKDIVLNNAESNLKDLILLSLIEECDLTHEVFREKSDYKKAKNKLSNITKDIHLAEDVNQAIQAIHAAVIEGIATAVITSTSMTPTED